MGLRTTHGAFEGAYGSFMDFRIRIGKEIGIDFKSMKYVGGDISWDTVDHPIKPLL